MSARKQKTIFHVDVNSAFLSWSAIKKLKEEPGSIDLRTVPSAVAGDVETRHGVVTAKSIPAGEYGVKTGEPVVKALAKCPNLIIVKNDMAAYRKYSHAFFKMLRTYCALVEQVSIDEAFMDMTGTESIYEQTEDDEPFPLNAAYQLKKDIRTALGFTVNIGISTNRLLAKMASDFEKPDKVHTLWPEEVHTKMWPLPIEKLYGCGESTAARLRALGVKTIGDAAGLGEETLCAHLGEKNGLYIFRSANGAGDADVSNEREEAKGYSNEVTLAHDITTENYAKETPQVLRALCEKVSARLRTDGVYASTIVVNIKTDRFVRHSRQIKLPDSTNSVEKIYEIATLLMKRLLFGEQGMFSKNSRIRLIGVAATGLDKGDFRQMTLFDMFQNQQAEG